MGLDSEATIPLPHRRADRGSTLDQRLLRHDGLARQTRLGEEGHINGVPESPLSFTFTRCAVNTGGWESWLTGMFANATRVQPRVPKSA